METLEQKIQKLTQEHEFKAFAKSISNGIKHTAIVYKPKNFISFKCKDINEAKYLLNTLKPINEKTIIGTASDKFYKVVDCPYRLDIKNPIQPNQWDDFSLTISFEISECDIKIDLPLHCFTHNFKWTTQKVNDSNLHYFGGVSLSKLKKMDFLAYTFNSENVINFYGAGKTLYSVSETNNIINNILNQ